MPQPAAIAYERVTDYNALMSTSYEEEQARMEAMRAKMMEEENEEIRLLISKYPVGPFPLNLLPALMRVTGCGPLLDIDFKNKVPVFVFGASRTLPEDDF